ncbi:dienelactone hydrolase [Bradyrhizobium ottawaense]
MRTTVEFPSEGALLRGFLYLPVTPDPHPCVVMAHGTSATISMAIDCYAEAFAAAGFAVLLYDHRNFGVSDGEPRQQINPWVQARGYRDAISYLLTRPDISHDLIAIWGFSYSGMQTLLLGAIDNRVRAVIAQCPVCGSQKPRTEPSDTLFNNILATFDRGDVSSTAETTTGPLPVVSFDQMGAPSLLKGIQAFRWFIEYGGRHGSNWHNSVTRIIPPTPVPFSPYLAAPFVRSDLLMMVGKADEMIHCNAEVARATFDLVPGTKEYIEIDGGHLGAMYHPGEHFERAAQVQIDFLRRRLRIHSSKNSI